MRPFDELTGRGRLRRLARLARQAAGEYPAVPDDVRVSLVAESFNTVFGVSVAGTRVSALRVGPGQRIHAESTELVEAQWMRLLRADRAAPAPEVFDDRNGCPVVRQSHPGIPDERLCMLFGWVPGTLLRWAMTAKRARRMGELAAHLHEHAAGIAGPDPPPVLIADRVLYWRVENRLGELDSSVIDEAEERAAGVLAGIWSDQPHAPHLLHGDFTASNIIVSGGRLVPIDFQDLVWGFDIQDLAISLESLGTFDQGGTLSEAFRSGYATVRPWPDLDPATQAALIAARRLHQLNLGLNLAKPGLADFVTRRCQLIGEWMSSTADGRRSH